jgi:hypothetical protein
MVMTIPDGLDSTKFHYWLWYNYQCHECTATEFQRMFENIMKRAKTEFIQIRPYGKIGDRKADGLLFAEGNVFQVYSPDDFSLEKAIKKIDEDLDGAVMEWKDDLRTWTFVYNVRRGLAPDIPLALKKKQKQYPNLKVDHLSKESLWDIARGLSIQQLSEVFGAPTGYEQYFTHSGTGLPTDPKISSYQNNRVVLIQDVNMPIDVGAVLEALKPEIPFGAPVFVSPAKSSFEAAAKYQQDLIKELQTNGRRILPARYAVFSLSPIPLIAHLGFLLTDSVDVCYFKYHIDSKSWKWPAVNPKKVDLNIHTVGLPKGIIYDPCEVAIRISISAKVWEHEVEEVVPNLPLQIHIYDDQPTLTWLRSNSQVERFAEVFRNVLTEIRNKLPRCKGIHLFFAGPAPIVLAAGQQINPRMNPPVHLYEYSKQTTPNYQYVLTLK